MTIQDPVFGELEWMPQMELWEGAAELPGTGTFLVGIEAPKAKALPTDYQRRGFLSLKEAWPGILQPQVARQVFDYWKHGVEWAGMFGSIPVDFEKANQIQSAEALYETLGLLTMTILSSKKKQFVFEMQFNWEWSMMGVLVQCVGTQVRRVVPFGQTDDDWMDADAA